jgi:hypothetical protein
MWAPWAQAVIAGNNKSVSNAGKTSHFHFIFRPPSALPFPKSGEGERDEHR